jgi:hypothetical protein
MFNLVQTPVIWPAHFPPDRAAVAGRGPAVATRASALSHYWRVSRQDNIVAQALLEKAIAIDPDYGQALGVLATSHTFSAHMGWADMATVAPIAERAAMTAILADGEDPWAHYALGSVYLFARRFDDSLAEFELAA